VWSVGRRRETPSTLLARRRGPPRSARARLSAAGQTTCGRRRRRRRRGWSSDAMNDRAHRHTDTDTRSTGVRQPPRHLSLSLGDCPEVMTTTRSYSGPRWTRADRRFQTYSSTHITLQMITGAAAGLCSLGTSNDAISRTHEIIVCRPTQPAAGILTAINGQAKQRKTAH